MILAMAVLNGWSLHQMDFETAYLNSRLSHTIYARNPPGIDCPYMILRRSLYGLKQSGREWNDLLTQWHTTDCGLTQSHADPCIFFNEDLVLAIYVDDVLMAGSPAKVQQLVDVIKRSFEVKDLGFPHIILGIEIVQVSHGIELHQRTYSEAILTRFGMENCNGRLNTAGS